MRSADLRGIVLLAMLCLTNSSAAAAEKAAPQPITGKAAIREALKGKISIDVDKGPLDATLKSIGEQLNVRIEIDAMALSDVGVAQDTPVTAHYNQVEARAALAAILRNVVLTWILQDEWLYITTQDRADVILETEVYDVTDLVLFQDDKGQWRDICDPLVEAIFATVKPGTWDYMGGPGYLTTLHLPSCTVLVVSQTEEALTALGDLLARLRTAATANKGTLPRPTPEQVFRRKVIATPAQEATARTEPDNILPANPNRDALARCVNAMGCDLYRKLAQTSHKNAICSPVGVAAVLGMLRDGAREETAAELARSLRLREDGGGKSHWALPEERIPTAFAALVNTFSATIAANGFDLCTASRLWGQTDGVQWEPRYRELLTSSHQADYQSVDFSRPADAARQIDEWTREKTRGLIRGEFPANEINSQTRFVLTNAVYFRGLWAEPFHKAATRPERFFADQGHILTPMMSQTTELKYAEVDGVQVVEKLYLGRAVSLLLALPRKSPGALAALEQCFTPELYETWTKALRERLVELSMPHFRFDAQYDLKGPLEQLGTKLVFDSDKANLRGIDASQPLFLQWIWQQARIEVDEEGTRAAAVTRGMGGGMGTPPKPVSFFADHPFLFFIRDVRTGAILFIGRVMTPDQEKPSVGGGGMF